MPSVKTYRQYCTIDNSTTTFVLDGKDLWLCTHGNWRGEVRNNNQLELYHAFGMASYKSFKEYTK